MDLRFLLLDELGVFIPLLPHPTTERLIGLGHIRVTMPSYVFQEQSIFGIPRLFVRGTRVIVPREADSVEFFDSFVGHVAEIESLIEDPDAQTRMVDWNVGVTVLEFELSEFFQPLLPFVGGVQQPDAFQTFISLHGEGVGFLLLVQCAVDALFGDPAV